MKRCIVPVVVVVCAGIAQAQQSDMPFKIGDSEFVRVESPRPYEPGVGGTQVVWTQTFHQEGKTFVRVHFTDDSALGPNDQVVIRDGEGRIVETYTAANIAGQWSPTTKGDTLTVEIEAAANGGGAGLVIDHVVWGFYPLFPDQQQGVVAGGGYFDICDTSVPDRIRTADPVSSINWVDDCGGAFICSAWLFSPYGHMMTNAHCANSANEANSLEMWYNYVPFDCDLSTEPNPDIYDDATFDSVGCDLDYAVFVSFDNIKGNPADVYGWLPINSAVPANGTDLWLPQHPLGLRKQIAENCDVNDNTENGTNFCADPGDCGNTGDPVGIVDLSFDCALDGGASGSPVLNTNDEVVAIAHATNGVEQFGIRMFNIAPNLPDPPILLELSGPIEVTENTSAQYVADVTSLRSGTHDFSDFATWSVTPSTAGTIDSTGLFTAAEVFGNTVATITASYTDDGFTVEDELLITVTDVPEPTGNISVAVDTTADTNNLTPGQQFTVDISVTADMDILDVRLLQFDTVLTTGATIDAVDWDLQGLDSDVLYLLNATGTIYSAAYTGLSSVPGFIVNIDEVSQIVAHVDVTFTGGEGAGEFNICGVFDPGTLDASVRFTAGFDLPVDYAQSLGNVSCATIPLIQGDVPISIVSSDPPSDSIDARQPSDPDGTDPAGLINAFLTFDGDPSGLVPGDFTVTEQGGDGVPPSIISVALFDVDTVQIVFSTRIEEGAWTTVTHDASGSSVRFGYLPADVNGDGTSVAQDLLALIDFLNGVVSLPIYSTDIDRSGLVGASDVVREIDLLNGAGVYDPWLGVSLP